jgi:glycosyltransferase involved in cell wall biosynthesis
LSGQILAKLHLKFEFVLKSKADKVANIAVWGRVPPPIGGMSVHLERLLPYLNEAGLTAQMYSVGRCTPEHPDVRQVAKGRFFWFFRLMFIECESIHYVFSDNAYARFAASLLSFLNRAKVVLRIGGETLTTAMSSRNPIVRFATRFAIRNADVIVGVNQEICKLAQGLGARKVFHIPGFIPAANQESAQLPGAVESFLNKVSGPILLASGEIGQNADDDLYGAYLLLNLVEQMPAINVIFYAYTITKPTSNQHMLLQEISHRNLTERYLLYQSEADLMPAMRKCTVLIRPTKSDGDSNSIREALHHGLPVVASDCVARPEGVVLFESGNVDALQIAVAGVLKDIKQFRIKTPSLPKTSTAEATVALFKELLKVSTESTCPYHKG